MGATEARPTPGAPFPCPNCGATDWWADYYDAVRQLIEIVVGEDGEPVFVDYAGGLDTYDDPATEDESWKCRECEYVLKVFGQFTFVAALDNVAPSFVERSRKELAELAEACGYDPDGDGSVDDLIVYKDALEVAYGDLLARVGGAV